MARSSIQRPRLPTRSFIGVVLLFFGVISHALPAPTWTVTAKPAKLLNGAPVLFQVKPSAKLDSLSGTWLGHQLAFTYDPAAKLWFALAGVTFETTPGKYMLELTGERGSAKVALKRDFPVAAASYPKIRVELAVEKKFTEPDPEQEAQIAEAGKIKDEYFSRPATERSWDGTFTAPVEAETSDVYGSQRIFNGTAQRPHWGLDYRVHAGTPVHAMNSGVVRLARFLYYEGNFAVIDHGQGLMTLYLHLSELKVKEGDTVKRGDEIGLSGASGRATGPHLDVRVRWQGTYLDPARLLLLPLP